MFKGTTLQEYEMIFNDFFCLPFRMYKSMEASMLCMNLKSNIFYSIK